MFGGKKCEVALKKMYHSVNIRKNIDCQDGVHCETVDMFIFYNYFSSIIFSPTRDIFGNIYI